MNTNGENTEPAARPRRVSQGEIILALLNRGSAGGSSVTLTRNAKGDTQIEVVVRTDEALGIPHPIDASIVAKTVYDSLAKTYPIGGDRAA